MNEPAALPLIFLAFVTLLTLLVKGSACKISGIVASARKAGQQRIWLPLSITASTALAPDRVIFASDWPVCTLGGRLTEWVGALEDIVSARSDEAQQKLFHDNAVRVYGLDRGN